ncbi:uncharacterized protein PG998_009281 [Apiospora kogelbergensis]|uniref:uncharacterized protein n=1 Tax=Apiospora kogelbergensis TaxID=1337665 RepID=UPI00312E813F
MAEILPSPRTILTSLINTLSSIPPAAPSAAQPALPSNPLRLLPPSQARPLLATLHTLYPNVLLPALDLLDRRLVARIIPVTSTAPDVTPVDAEAVSGATSERDMGKQGEPSLFYLVRSAQQPSRRGRRAVEALNEGGGTGPTYIVQTRAWNCSCAAFAFSAFPIESATPAYRISPSAPAPASSSCRNAATAAGRHEVAGDEIQEDDDHGTWGFGGMSRDGLGSGRGNEGSPTVGNGGVPCCKHLLACILAERWTDVLGAYVTERQASKEEAAGLIAGI